MFRAHVSFLCLTVIGLSLPESVAAAVPKPKQVLTPAVLSMRVGVEVPVVLDHEEVVTFNEGVMAEEKDRIKKTHDPRRMEKWHFSADLQQVVVDGNKFEGMWRSARFQDNYFVEFIRVEGELSGDSKRIVSLRVRKIRFDKTSLEEPVNRGYTYIALLFENLPDKRNFPKLPPSYRFVPGVSKVTIEKAFANYVETKYHSRTTGHWKALRIDDSANPITGIRKELAAGVETTIKPQKAFPAPSRGAAKRILVVRGNWQGLKDLIARLSRLPDLVVVDESGKEVGGDTARPTLVVDTTGTEPRDWSAHATFNDPRGEVSLDLALDFQRFSQFGDEALAEWIQSQAEVFQQEIVAALVNAGF